jgi:hypothetical protein
MANGPVSALAVTLTPPARAALTAIATGLNSFILLIFASPRLLFALSGESLLRNRRHWHLRYPNTRGFSCPGFSRETALGSALGFSNNHARNDGKLQCLVWNHSTTNLLPKKTASNVLFIIQ